MPAPLSVSLPLRPKMKVGVALLMLADKVAAEIVSAPVAPTITSTGTAGDDAPAVTSVAVTVSAYRVPVVDPARPEAADINVPTLPDEATKKDDAPAPPRA